MSVRGQGGGLNSGLHPGLLFLGTCQPTCSAERGALAQRGCDAKSASARVQKMGPGGVWPAGGRGLACRLLALRSLGCGRVCPREVLLLRISHLAWSQVGAPKPRAVPLAALVATPVSAYSRASFKTPQHDCRLTGPAPVTGGLRTWF